MYTQRCIYTTNDLDAVDLITSISNIYNNITINFSITIVCFLMVHKHAPEGMLSYAIVVLNYYYLNNLN